MHRGWRNLTAKGIGSVRIYTQVTSSAALFLQTALHAVSAALGPLSCTSLCAQPGASHRGLTEHYPKHLPLSSLSASRWSSQTPLQSVPHLNTSTSSPSIQKQTSVGLTATFLIHFINKQLRILLQVAARVAHAVDGALCGVRHDAIRVQLFIIERLGTALLHHQLQPFSCVRVGSPTARSLLKVFIALPLCL